MTQTTAATITLIGCGNMGRALLDGWLKNQAHNTYNVIDPSPLHDSLINSTLNYAPNTDQGATLLSQSDVIILAIKPQIMGMVCSQISQHISKDSLILSIAAGTSIAFLHEHFDKNQAIVRAMPNTPAAIGKGMSVAVSNTHVSATQKRLTTSLLQSAGLLEWLDDESLLNTVTALSGSGPGYMFYIIEALTQAAIHAGLNQDLARMLARQTVIGSAGLAEANPDISAKTLRENVTSPGGTTAAGLQILMNGDFQNIMNNVIQAATKRGEDLSKN